MDKDYSSEQEPVEHHEEHEHHHDHEEHEHHHEHHHDHEEHEHHHEDGECHCHHEDGECDCHHDHEDGECHCHHDHEDGKCCCHHHHGEGGHTEEFGIGTFVYYRRLPLVRSKFRSFVNEMPESIIRTKGIVWYSNDNDNMYIFEQAGLQKESFKADVWIDTLPEEEKKYYIAENPDIKRDWDEKVGDRMVKIVFIGQKMDKDKIIAELDKCLDK